MPQDKKKDVLFYDPKAEADAKRKKLMAESLIEKGNKEFQNETAGGMTVARSPWEFAGKAAQKYYGEYKLGEAENEQAQIEKKRQQAIAEALSQYGENPQATAQILAQDPRTSNMAMQLMGNELGYKRDLERDDLNYQRGLQRDELNYQRDMDRFNKKMAFDREMAQQRAASGGGNIPAAMQISNQMFELEQAMMNPNLSPQERFLAERQYNLLGQAAKTYGFDRGIQAQGLGGYEDVYGDSQEQKVLQAPQVGSISGYDEAMGQREGTKEAMKSRAKYMEEGFQKLPKMQRALQDAEFRNQNVMRVADLAMQASNDAFTTGFTGSIMDSVAGSPAFDLKQNLQTLEAVAAFDTLQNMRDNSPTGGALGQVTERELDLLKAAYSNLLNSQSREQFQENLQAFISQNQQSLQNARNAYEQDYLRFGGQEDKFLPAPQQSQNNVFNTIEEAEAANLPVGTEIVINGRRAVIE